MFERLKSMFGSKPETKKATGLKITHPIPEAKPKTLHQARDQVERARKTRDVDLTVIDPHQHSTAAFYAEQGSPTTVEMSSRSGSFGGGGASHSWESSSSSSSSSSCDSSSSSSCSSSGGGGD